MQPELNISVQLFGSATLKCDADGNPPPRYEWWHSMTDSTTTDEKSWIPRGNASVLQLQNVTYSDQGKYICKVMNYIGGSEHSARNELTRLTVYGML